MPRYLGSGTSPEKWWFSVWGTASLLRGPGVWPRWSSHKRGTTAPFVHPNLNANRLPLAPGTTCQSCHQIPFCWLLCCLLGFECWALSKGRCLEQEDRSPSSEVHTCSAPRGLGNRRHAPHCFCISISSSVAWRNLTEPSVWPFPVLFSMDFPGEWEVDDLSNVTSQMSCLLSCSSPSSPHLLSSKWSASENLGREDMKREAGTKCHLRNSGRANWPKKHPPSCVSRRPLPTTLGASFCPPSHPHTGDASCRQIFTRFV